MNLTQLNKKQLKKKVKKEKLAVQHNLLLTINSIIKSFNKHESLNAKNDCTKQIQELSTSLAIISGSN